MLLTGATLLSAIVALFAADAPQSSPAAAPATGFLDRTVVVDGVEYAYCVYVPRGYSREKKWPIILFLHGSGERGDDGLKQTEVGIGRAIRLHRQWIPAIVVMPQCRANDVWWSPAMTKMTFACMNAAGREFRIDAQRVYVTGLSLGGGACWHFAAQMQGQVAAVAPLAALSDAQMGYKESLAPKLKDVPIWCFHGAVDQNVPVQSTRDMVKRIKAAGGNVEYTEYPGRAHVIWNAVYDDARLWKWLFEQKLGAKDGAGG